MKADSLIFKCTVTVPCEMKRNRRRRHKINVSPCKHSRHSTLHRLEQPACCGWRQRRIFCREGVESNLSQSSHFVCYACRQPRFLRRPTQLLCTNLSVLPISWPGWSRALAQHPTSLPPHLSCPSFGRYGVIC